MQKVAAPVRRNMLARTDDGDGLASGNETIIELKYDYGQVDEVSRTAIKNAALDIKRRERRAALDIVAIGRSLTEVKRLLSHGQFLPWIETEFGWQKSMAENFMNVADKFPKFGNINNFGLSALYLLSGPSVPDEVVVLARQIAETGDKVTHKVAKALVDKAKPAKPPPPTTYPIPADLLAAGYTVESHPAGGYGVIHTHAQGRVHLPQVGSLDEAIAQIEAHRVPTPALRTLTLDETIAVIWRLLKHGNVGEQRPEKLKGILAMRTKPEDYRHVHTGDVALDAAVFTRAWRTINNELDGSAQRAPEHKAKANQRIMGGDVFAPDAFSQAPATITLTFALLGDEAERKAQYDWFKGLEQTTLAAYMQALYQTNGEAV